MIKKFKNHNMGEHTV